MRIMQSPSLFEPSIQIPLIQKKNNNKNNKNLSLIKIQNKKNEEDEYEDESEINNLNENIMDNSNSKRKVIENIPQLINSFYYLNENLRKQNNISNEILENNNDDKEIKSNNFIRNLKSKIKEKSKHKKTNYIFNVNLLEVLENYDLTNEEKLLYILDNYKNVKIDPIILKVLEYRKKRKKNDNFENKNLNILNNQNIEVEDETKIKIDSNGNNINNLIENNEYVPRAPIKINFPIEDKILFKNLEKYKVNRDILDRPTSIKIELEFDILNKLFIIWDFLITFNDIVFTEKVCDFQIDKNILTFYSKLLDEKNNYSYYKNILISLILLCVKNIPYAVPSPKNPRLFLLKSILDNLHSISYNIISDSPIVVLREITNCYLYNNSISEQNLSILTNIFVEVNNPNNKENFENNIKIYENENEKEDNIFKIDKNTKIYLLNIIVGLCFETILIKDKIKLEYENMNSLSYAKKGLDESLFDTEKRIKELNKMENFKTLPKEIGNLEKKLSELKQNKIKVDVEKEKGESKNEGNNKILKEEEKNRDIKNEEENAKKKKEIQELERQIERYKSILIEDEKLIERKKEINTKISEIFEKIYNLKTLRKKYLGIDYQNNEYYYFISSPNKIYVKNKKIKEWGYYDNKDDILKLINKLTDKGKNEKKLKIILKLIFSQMKEKEQNENENNKEKEISNKENIQKIEGKKDEIITNINENKMEEEKIENTNIENKKEEKSLKNKIHYINLRGDSKRRGKKPKEDINVDNIHISEDEEEIIEDNEKEEIKENDIEIDEKKNTFQNKNKEKDIYKEKDNKITQIVQPKKEIFTFIINDDKLPLNIILMKIDDVFSEYLVQFNKQWESEKNRAIWKSIITYKATDKNILTSLKMFNHKFKNPYKILSAEEEKELILKEKINKGNNFVFDEENGNKFSIPETNNLLLLSPKVKIWSKEMDLIDIDNYYINDLLVNVYSREQLGYVVHFYEMAIFGLIHRREGKRKL